VKYSKVIFLEKERIMIEKSIFENDMKEIIKTVHRKK